MALAEAEWKGVCDFLHILVAMILSLAKRNTGFRGSTEALKTPDNRHLPDLIQHVSVESAAGRYVHYLSKTIPNELVDSISSKITNCDGNQNSKYFSIILDCTPDLSHEEQLSHSQDSVRRRHSWSKIHFLRLSGGRPVNWRIFVTSNPKKAKRI